MYSEVDRLKARYAKDIEAGRKIETLTSMDEWHFYAEVLRNSADELVDRIIRGEFLSNQREEDFNKGVANAIYMLIDGVDNFKTRAKDARGKARALEDEAFYE